MLKLKKVFAKLTLALALTAGVSFAASQVPSAGQPVQAASKKTERNKVVSLAKKQVGKRYVWGATGPYSFDCSGLTMYVYKHALGVNLPHYSVSQLYYGKAVSTKKLQQGDLLFFGSKRAPSHVGIYVGGNKFVHASSPTVGVIKSTVSTRPSSVFYPSSARRLI